MRRTPSMWKGSPECDPQASARSSRLQGQPGLDHGQRLQRLVARARKDRALHVTGRSRAPTRRRPGPPTTRSGDPPRTRSGRSRRRPREQPCARRYPAVRSGTIARCPHRSTAPALASWTISSCCSPGHWLPAPPSTSPTRASPWPSRPSWPTPPQVELVDPEGLPLALYTAESLSPLATPAYGPFRRLHLTPGPGAPAVRRSADRPRRSAADRTRTSTRSGPPGRPPSCCSP